MCLKLVNNYVEESENNYNSIHWYIAIVVNSSVPHIKIGERCDKEKLMIHSI
jgi:hypothetical protein